MSQRSDIMKCLNCGYEITEGYICPSCGADAYIFHKARNVSIRLYNEALQKAASRDLPAQLQIWSRAFFLIKITFPRGTFWA